MYNKKLRVIIFYNIKIKQFNKIINLTLNNLYINFKNNI